MSQVFLAKRAFLVQRCLVIRAAAGPVLIWCNSGGTGPLVGFPVLAASLTWRRLYQTRQYKGHAHRSLHPYSR